MNNKFITLCLVSAISILPVVSNATGLVSPSSAKVTFYSMWVSANADCSGATEVVALPSGNEVDIALTPTPLIGTGNIANGTYPCLIFEFSDLWKIIAAASDDGACIKDAPYTLDVCLTEPGTTKTTKNPLNGNITTCSSTGTDDRVFLYVSTNSIVTNLDDSAIQAYMPPLNPNDPIDGLKLDNAISISGNTTGTLTIGLTNKLTTINNRCSFGTSPTFSLTTQ